MIAWLLRNPAQGLSLVVVVVLFAALGIRTWQLRSAETTIAHHLEVISTMRAAVELQNAAVDQAQAAAEGARKRGMAALQRARAASATRQPAIAALANAEQAGGALSCGDAVERVRDALGQ
jgi:hypothetical protein